MILINRNACVQLNKNSRDGTPIMRSHARLVFVEALSKCSVVLNCIVTSPWESPATENAFESIVTSATCRAAGFQLYL